jgi:alpha-tubulin suppressor-like RCC1 family protein
MRTTKSPISRVAATIGLLGALTVAGITAASRANADAPTVYAWGDNSFGQLGQGNFGNADPTPEEVESGSSGSMNVAQAYGGGNYELATQEDGTVDAWGGNGYGQLGLGDTGTAVTTPTQIPDLDDAVAVAASIANSVVVNGDGTVDWWGAYDGGVQTSPTEEPGIDNAVAVGAGEDYELALLDDGTVDGWGFNGNGELGDEVATGTNTSNAMPIDGLSGVQAISAGDAQVVALMDDGTVETWGDNTDGELGNGTVGGPDPCSDGTDDCNDTPATVPGLSDIVDVSAGDGYDLAVDASGNVWAWGATCQSGSCDSDGVLEMEPMLDLRYPSNSWGCPPWRPYRRAKASLWLSTQAATSGRGEIMGRANLVMGP